MEDWRKDARREAIIVDLDALVPKDHLLRKIEKVMDYAWLYERLDPYYCHDNGRPGTDPVVLIKMVLIQHLFGIPSLRQTYREIQVNNAYRWFLGYGLLDSIPHFATVSYAFCKRFPDELNTRFHLKSSVFLYFSACFVLGVFTLDSKWTTDLLNFFFLTVGRKKLWHLSKKKEQEANVFHTRFVCVWDVMKAAGKFQRQCVGILLRT